MTFIRKLAAGLACLAALSLASLPARAQAPAATYHFSPVNQHSLQLSASYWNPILEYVSQRSGVTLQLKLGRTSAETTALVLAGESDFAFTNHLFSPERAKLGWKVFGRRNAPPVSGQIIVPDESPIRTLADLGDKDIAFPGPEALVAYKVTYAQLLERRIPARAVFAGNLDAAFTQLVSGRTAAMGTNSQMVAEYAARENRKFRVLWSSAPFSDLALMASPRVPDAQVQAVARAFLGMHRDPEGRQVLEASARVIQAKDPVSFVAATDADYASYRDFYRTAPAALR
ncbi:phosphate/phosphite/phosphonate ABC transporter substrate-binding protein [Ramlibacter sp. MAHUQ-53]|uniref:phosphate/phosphite/phosphonate ABC transporter substrate-binding protein n=1 Tax=unclassified Ramlibacter TaxID=2617605 RepID=UPI0036428209